jgi:hypothetical protein
MWLIVMLSTQPNNNITSSTWGKRGEYNCFVFQPFTRKHESTDICLYDPYFLFDGVFSVSRKSFSNLCLSASIATLTSGQPAIDLSCSTGRAFVNIDANAEDIEFCKRFINKDGCCQRVPKEIGVGLDHE